MLVAPKRVLFVDDEPAIRGTLPAILSKPGFEVIAAATTEEALSEAQKHTFDLLLCDLNVSHMNDGLEVVRAIRATNPGCVTIILTGYPAIDSAIEGIHLGIDDYLIKPAEVDGLLRLLSDRLKSREFKARILSVSYDDLLLRMRHMILEKAGYAVVSAHGFENAIRGPRAYQHEELPLGPSWADVQRLLASRETNRKADIRDRPVILLLAVYGLRVGEVQRLRLEDINWEQKTISIAATKQHQTRVCPIIPVYPGPTD